MKVSINSTVWYDPRTVDWYLKEKKKLARLQSDIMKWENLPANSVVVDINLSQTSHHLKPIIGTIGFNFFIVIPHLRPFKIYCSESGRTSHYILTMGSLTYRERKTIGDFKNTTNIKSKKLPCDKRRCKLLAVFDYLQHSLSDINTHTQSSAPLLLYQC